MDHATYESTPSGADVSFPGRPRIQTQRNALSWMSRPAIIRVGEPLSPQGTPVCGDSTRVIIPFGSLGYKRQVGTT